MVSNLGNKRKIKWKNVILAAIVVFLLIYIVVAGISAIVKASKANKEETYSACNLSTKKLLKKINSKEYEGTITFSDYIYYGEYLSLFQEAYELDGASGFEGRSIVLKNLCDDKIYKYDVKESLDGQIDLKDLEVGLYEVYVVENLKEKRVYAENVITSSAFYTVGKGENRNVVTLYANAALFNSKDDIENKLDKNYLFIEVSSKALAEKVYDIAINPGPIAPTEPLKAVGNGIEEITESYRLAKAIADRLTTDGYKVLITRDQYDAVGLYGTEGTLAKAYTCKTKYLFSYEMYESKSKNGFKLIHSSYISDEFGKSISDALKAIGMTSQEESVVSSVRNDGYDIDWDIREAGGKALQAGTANETCQDLNAFMTNYNGIEAIYMELLNIKSEDEVVFYLNNFDKIVEAIVQGIEKYLG